MRKNFKIILPLLQIFFAAIVLIFPHYRSPKYIDDSHPFVPLAVTICQAINAPASLMAVGLTTLSEKAHLQFGMSLIALMRLYFFCGILIVWFLVGLEFDSRPLVSTFARPQLLRDCVALIVVIVLALFATTALRQGEMILGVGSLVWCVLLALYYGTDLLRSFFKAQTKKSTC